MSVLEREIKLAVTPDFRLPFLTDLATGVTAGREQTVELAATYFDTSDLRISRAGASLRYRDPEGWTVKLPARDGDRDGDEEAIVRVEHHVQGPRPTGDGSSTTPPPEALDLVRSLTRGAAVEALATLHTTRRVVALCDTAGHAIGEVVDDRVEIDSQRTEPGATVFREVELELADDATPSQRLALLTRLRTAGAGAADPTPKIVRALGAPARAPADVQVPRIDADEPAAANVVRAAIATSVVRLVRNDPGARLGDDAESLHQARVATRRLRSDLRTFEPLLDEGWAEALRDELRWLGDVFGAVRDADVLIERFEPEIQRLPASDRPPAETVLDRLRADRERAREQMLVALRNERYDRLLDRLVEAASRPRLLLQVDDTDDRARLTALVREPVRALLDAADALGPKPRNAALHQVRRRAKRVRYAAEAVAPALGRPARRLARIATEIQDVLGVHQDAVIAAEWLRRVAANDGAGIGFAAGQLAALEHREARRARRRWPKTWQRTHQKQLRTWL